MEYEYYIEQLKHWPVNGQHILANYDRDSIVVYQAYRDEIADYALSHQCFGGAFSYSRMSWIKPNFLWMMFRSGWATKPGQERILAVRLRRTFFDALLEQAVSSSLPAGSGQSREDWQAAVKASDVRLQWDPDHDPFGAPIERRAVQLGLRGRALETYGKSAIVSIADMTEFVRTQRRHVTEQCEALLMPVEHIYVPGQKTGCAQLGGGCIE